MLKKNLWNLHSLSASIKILSWKSCPVFNKDEPVGNSVIIKAVKEFNGKWDAFK